MNVHIFWTFFVLTYPTWRLANMTTGSRFLPFFVLTSANAA